MQTASCENIIRVGRKFQSLLISRVHISRAYEVKACNSVILLIVFVLITEKQGKRQEIHVLVCAITCN